MSPETEIAESMKWETILPDDFPFLRNKFLSLTEITMAKLPFYKRTTLVRVCFTGFVDTELRYLIHENEKLIPLNGSSIPIHEINRRENINLNENNVAAYLKFFCEHVRGDLGPFVIVETLDEEVIQMLQLPQKDSQYLRELISPLHYKGKSNEDTYLIEATVLYSSTLFHSKFAINSSGVVEMLEDKSLYDRSEPMLKKREVSE